MQLRNAARMPPRRARTHGVACCRSRRARSRACVSAPPRPEMERGAGVTYRYSSSRTPALFPTSVRNVFHGAPTESHSTLLSTPSRVAVSTVSYVPATRSRTAPRARDSSSFLCWLSGAATATEFTYAWPWWRRAAWCQRSSLSAYTVHTLPRPRARPQRTPASTHTKRRSRREGLRSRKRRRPLRERG